MKKKVRSKKIKVSDGAEKPQGSVRHKSSVKADKVKKKSENKIKKTSRTDKINKAKKDRSRKKTPVWLWVVLAISITILVIMLGVLARVLLNKITTTEETFEDEITYYTTEYIDDNAMEMGTQTTERAGVKGTRRKYYNVKKTLIDKNITSKNLVRSEDIEQPVNEVIRRGTRKWQYMWCSDGSYMYYTDEQFTDPNTGYTHASEDRCAKDGHGTMTQLADAPPNVAPSNVWRDPYTGETAQELKARLSWEQVQQQSQRRNELETELIASNECADRADRDYQAFIKEHNLYYNAEEFNSLWSACMSDKGYGGLTNIHDFGEWLNQQLNNL